MNQSQHQARAGPWRHHTACFNERQKHHSVGLDLHNTLQHYDHRKSRRQILIITPRFVQVRHTSPRTLAQPTNHPDCFPDASGPLGISPASNERPAQMKLYPYARANEHNLSGSPVAPFKMR